MLPEKWTIVHQIWGVSVDWRNLNTAKFCRTPRKWLEISAIENFWTWKSGPKFTKITRPTAHECPHCAKFHCAWPNDVQEKCSKNFLHPSLFWCPRGTPLGQSPSVSALMYSKGRSVNVPYSDNPSTVADADDDLLAKFVSFANSVTDKKHAQKQ